jgi:adenylate cyclase class 2
MSQNNEEHEVKFFIRDLGNLNNRLDNLGAVLIQPRTYEYNLRFDNAAGELTRTFQVLRLRKDTAVRLTYKGPGEIIGGVQSRAEIEFTVDDFDSAQKFFQALGYQVSMIYEKYRTIYQLNENVLVTLDEMPYGDFAEIEGPDAPSILGTALQLSLDLNARILTSYAAIFESLRRKFGLNFRDLTFENFEGLNITAGNLGLKVAE